MAYHAQRGGISSDQRWNNTAALTTLRLADPFSAVGASQT